LKIRNLLAILAIVCIALITGCKKDDFVEIVGVCPVVESTNPSNAATGIPLNMVITATFNEEMNPATITQASFYLTGGEKASVPVQGTLSYNGATATLSFVPTSPLTSNTTYTGTVKSSVKDLKGNALQTDYVWTFSTGATLSPTVVSTNPENNATGIFINTIVSATFSTPMDALSITTTSFNIKQGINTVAGTVSYTGITASFMPSAALTPNTVYTATITSGVKNIAGTTLENNYVWTFTTGTLTGPSVISTDPTNNATGVNLDQTITATFSLPMNPLTITTASFTLKQGGNSVEGTVSYSGTTASFVPANQLAPNSTYVGTITTFAKNVAGISLAGNYVWSFTTGSFTIPTVIATDPANNATGVVLNKIVTVSFSVPMDPLTLTSSTFTIKQGTTTIVGSIAYAGTIASFTPSEAFIAGKIYTGTITTGAMNVAGIPLAGNYVWNFTTLSSATVPVVLSSDPGNNASEVVLDKIITATFNMPMDPLTINTTSFTLKQGANSVEGTILYTGTTASFTPSVNLLPGLTYTATITTAAMNVTGIPLADDYVWNFNTLTSVIPAGVDLGSVERFGIIAGVGVSNNAGPSEIQNMDVGISPGVHSSIVGFPPAIVVNGAIYASDDLTPPGVAAMLIQAKLDLTAAYLFAEGATSPAPTTVAGDQGGKTLAPGIYKSTSTLLIQSGDLTLDAQGDPNAVWIFQIASDFTTIGGAGGSVILSGGAQAKNVFWQTGSSATIGDYTSFKGNVLALTSITMNSHATAVGRMLARNGAVVMTSTNIITKP